MPVKGLTTTAGGGTLLGCRGGGGLGLNGNLLALALGFLRRRIPVVDHLEREDCVQEEARDEAVENKLVIDLLQCGEDSRQRSGKVVEDLKLLVSKSENKILRERLTAKALS